MKRASQRERPPPLQIQKAEDRNGRGNAIAGHPYPQQLYRQPAIYQTRSPDVINADPHDFMAMVQKLTGQARSHGILSPLAKRPCLPGTSSNAAVSSSAHNHSHGHSQGSMAPAAEIGGAEMEAAAGLHGAVPSSYDLISQVQNLQRKEQLGFAASNASASASASNASASASASNASASASNASASASNASVSNASAPFSFASASSSASAEPGRARKANLGLGLGLGLQQREHASWSQAVGALLSPSNFVLSPSLLPSPSTFLKDFPFLKPPPPPFPSSSSSSSSSSPAPSAADALLPPSPKLSMEAGRLYDSLRTPKLELPGHEVGSKLEEPLLRSPALGFLSSASNPAGMEAAAEGADPPHHHPHLHHLHHLPQRSPLGFPNHYSPGPLTRYLTDLPLLSPAGAYKWIDNDPSPLPQSSRSHGLPPRPPSQYRSDA